jgi:alpha-beta hydrolase superfamily lysophospholipase
MAFKENPIDLLEPLAKAGIPLIHVVGDADDVVPVEENTALIEQRYQALGEKMKVFHKPGVGHHPHGLEDPAPLVELIEAYTASATSGNRQ